MNIRNCLLLSFLVLLIGISAGCARAARDTTGFSIEDSATVEASFDETWQTVKTVLREKDLELYTRDKRGVFVAYTPMKRRLLQPRRTQFTIELGAVSSGATRIQVETLDQVYGVTLLTYPGWHDRKTQDNHLAVEIIEAVQQHVSGVSAVEETS